MRKLLTILCLLVSAPCFGQMMGSIASPVKSAASGGTTIYAASCNPTDVLTALNSITMDGTTVILPTCNVTWTTAITYNQTNSFILQGQGAIYPGGGTDKTVIQDNYNYTSGSGFININTIAGKSLRITGIAFYWSTSQTSVTNNGEVQLNGYSQSVRIDHSHFYQPAGATNGIVVMSVWNWIYGVADHNQIDFTSNDSNWIRVGMPSYGNDSAGLGNISWSSATNFGSSGFFFLEANTFNWNGATSNPATDFAAVNDCNAGGRMVFRYNTVNGLWLTQMHEMEGDFRGCRAFEDYQNTYAGSGTNPFATAFGTRMATSLVWGNTVTGFSDLGNATNDRTNTGHGFGAAPPAVAAGSTTGWGYCGTSTGGSGANLSPSDYDYSQGSNGYPCADQVGRGQSAVVTGTFPNKFISGSIQWVNNALEPVYVWDNTYNAPSVGTNHYFTSSDTNTIQENRDYYLQLPNYDESSTFNGTAGIGQGLLSARPSTCTPLVAYWATNTSTLYVCKTANSWSSYYTPYTYPHPLDN
jgi:hypothetical protein